jgi:hypothetical protein
MKRGSITPALLIITGAFLVVIYGLLLVLTLQFDYSNRQVGSDQALHVAEAGVNYYRWHLAHDPTDYKDGQTDAGPYEHEYLDPQGNAIGKYSLTITPPSSGSSIVTLESVGWTYQYPKVKRTIIVQYGRPSFAQYAFLQNSSSWYAAGITVNGKIHSNNGIRMDGTNLSLVTSAQADYQCGNETGCSPPAKHDGVWGAGGDKGLWQFPVPPIDFDAITFDLAQMRTIAQSSGIYLGPSNKSGYHIIFNNDGTYTIKRVITTNAISGYMVPGQGLGSQGLGGCRERDQIIQTETTIGTYVITEKPIVFVEDNVWVEGVVHGRMSVVSASFPIGSSNVSTWINGNITYTAYDGSDVLGLISQNDLYITRDVPDDFQVDAVLMSQNGAIIRHGYISSCNAGPASIKNSLTMNGAVINFDKSYWNWGSPLESGFRTRTINYDTHILYAPPPYFPSSGEYQFINWRED